ncbi:hypothetical protein [Paraburkholderia sprentiae]|uniref:Uncharacterized protein n=1 Tax=Paraburkholderia sprentiae WSM5005 TaxID=754502 RepID=A0A1I9YNC4_9BURK
MNVGGIPLAENNHGSRLMALLVAGLTGLTGWWVFRRSRSAPFFTRQTRRRDSSLSMPVFEYASQRFKEGNYSSIAPVRYSSAAAGPKNS